jgi:hypothetical protein
LKFSIDFLYYDFWVGFFWDKAKHILYFAPLPCCVLKFQFKHRCLHCNGSGEQWVYYKDLYGNAAPSFQGNCEYCKGYGTVIG